MTAVGTLGAIGVGAITGAMIMQTNNEQDASITNNAATILSNYDSLTGSSM